jgi:hypothetical protein
MAMRIPIWLLATAMAASCAKGVTDGDGGGIDIEKREGDYEEDPGDQGDYGDEGATTGGDEGEGGSTSSSGEGGGQGATSSSSSGSGGQSPQPQCGDMWCDMGEEQSCPQDCPQQGQCAHDPCMPGPALDPMCDQCVDLVCQLDDYCCTTDWDETCVTEIDFACGCM